MLQCARAGRMQAQPHHHARHSHITVPGTGARHGQDGAAGGEQRPVLALPVACPPPPSPGLAPSAPCKQRAKLCAMQTRRQATQTPGQHRRVVLELTGPRQDLASGAAWRGTRCHHGQSHISGERGWAGAGPWGARTCPAADGPGAEAKELPVLDLAPGEAAATALPTIPTIPTIPTYNQTSPAPVPIPHPTAESWGSFQPHKQLHSSANSCPTGPASFCPP